MSVGARSKRSIVILPDERASRERALAFNQTLQVLRAHAKVEVWPEGLDEEAALAKLEQASCDLVLLPWYRYLSWSRVEGHFGLNRTQGRTCAGYFIEPILNAELDYRPSYQRIILLDFTRLSARDSALLALSLADEGLRCGLPGLFDSKPAPKFWSTKWNSQDDLGAFLVELSKLDVRNDASFLNPFLFKSALLALWDIVFEESGRRAVFEIAFTTEKLAVRVIYPKQGWSPVDVIDAFYPSLEKRTQPYQLLRALSDALRVHWIAERGEIEITLAFTADAPTEKGFDEIHTLWVEPIAPHLLTDEKSGLKLLSDTLHAREKSEADRLTEKLEQLRKELQLKEKKIQEMRMGGVGQPPPQGLPEPQMLIDAFSQRFFENIHRVRQLKEDIDKASGEGAFQSHVEHLKKELAQAHREEDAWMMKIAAILKAYREHRDANAGK